MHTITREDGYELWDSLMACDFARGFARAMGADPNPDDDTKPNQKIVEFLIAWTDAIGATEDEWKE